MGAREVEAGKAFVTLAIRDKITAGLKMVERKVAGFGSSLSSVGSGLAGMGAGVTAAFGGLAGALSVPLKMAANLETVQTSFTTMLGSAEAATAMMGRLKKFAAETPLEFSDIADAAKKLIAFGVSAKDVEAELRRVGDIASGIGAPIGEIAEIYGKAKVQGRLFAEDINQLTGRGIPIIQELAKQFGVTDNEVKKLVESGQVNFGHLQQSFVALTSKGGTFFQSMQNQSQTLLGKFSTFKDGVIEALMPIGEALAELAKPTLAAAGGILSSVAKVIEANKGWAKVLAAVAAAGTVAGVVILALGGAFVVLGMIVSAVSTVVGAVTAVVTAIGAPVIGIVALVGVAIAAVVTGIGILLYQSGLAGEAMAWLSSVFGGMAKTVSQTFGALTAALSSGEYSLAAQVLWAGVKVVFYQGTQAALEAVEYLYSNMLTLTGRFAYAYLKNIYNTFLMIPRLMMSALSGGGSLLKILSDSLTGNLDLGGLVDAPLANARQELDALTKQIEAKQKALAPKPTQQQPQLPPQMPITPRPPGVPMTPQQMLGGPTAADVERMQREHFMRENMAAYQRAGIRPPMGPSQIRAPGELRSPAERLAAEQRAAEEAKARALAAAQAEQKAIAKRTPMLPDMGAMAGGGGLPKTEARGTFSAAAAAAFSGRSSAPEETARNTRMIAKFTKISAEKPGPAFT